MLQLLIAPAMVNLNLNALNNCTKTWTYQCTTTKKLMDHQGQPLHNKNMSYRHAINKVQRSLLFLNPV